MTTCATCQTEFTKQRMAKDLTGERFGRWIVLGRSDNSDLKMWLCRCDCGTEKPVYHGHLVNGKSKGCRCGITKHGMCRTPEYTSWVTMKRRCGDPGFHAYPRYGGAGITVCDRWSSSFEAFHADMGSRPAGKTLDRIDGSRGYEPGNCRWSTPKEQANNRRSSRIVEIDGQKLTVSEMADRQGVKYVTLYSRLKRNGSI